MNHQLTDYHQLSATTELPKLDYSEVSAAIPYLRTATRQREDSNSVPGIAERNEFIPAREDSTSLSSAPPSNMGSSTPLPLIVLYHGAVGPLAAQRAWRAA